MLKPSLETHNVDGILVAEFWDCFRLDPAPVQDLRAAYETHLKNRGRPEVVVDLSGVGFAGSAALGNFVALHRQARQRAAGWCCATSTRRSGKCCGRASSTRCSSLPVTGQSALREIKRSASGSAGGASRSRRGRSAQAVRRVPKSRSACALAAGETRLRLTKPPCAPVDPRNPTVSNGMIDYSISGVSTMSATTRIQVTEHDGIKVVRFQDHQLFDERTVREIADQIAEALPNDGSPIRLVVDFSDVSLISSTFLSKLILLAAPDRRHPRQDAALRNDADHPAGLPHLEPRSSFQDRPRSADRDRVVSVTFVKPDGG